VEYARLYESPLQYGTTIWSPLASGVLSGKYSQKKFDDSNNRLGDKGGAQLKEQLESGQGLNGLEEKMSIVLWTLLKNCDQLPIN